MKTLKKNQNVIIMCANEMVGSDDRSPSETGKAVYPVRRNTSFNYHVSEWNAAHKAGRLVSGNCTLFVL